VKERSPKRSIRRRLALALVAYSMGCVVLSLLAVYAGVVVPDRQRVDSTLLEEIGNIRALDGEADHGPVEKAIAERSGTEAESGLFYAYWENETQITLAGNMAPPAEGALGLPGTLADSDGARLATYVIQERHLRVARQVMPSDRSVVVAQDITPQMTFERRLIETSMIVGLIALMLAIGTGLWLSRGLLGRVERMNRIILSILGGKRDARVPVNQRSDEFDTLALHFNKLLDENARLIAQMSEVTENIAHDLRTPLTRIRGSIESALSSAREASADTEVMHRVLADTTDLLETFGALLSIARVESGAESSSMKTLDLSQLTRDAVELYEPAADEAGCRIDFTAEESLSVRGHRHLLFQALSNLIDNALKFAASSGSLEVNVRRGPSGPELSISDRGPGIPEDQRKYVLQRFVRLEQSRNTPGTGLGLSLVAAVAQMHGASLTLSDNAPGLCITIAFPEGAPLPLK
jgi:signal transduction histidine kinase